MTSQDIEWTRGGTETWTLNIYEADGVTPDNLSDATAIEFEVKLTEDAKDPALLHLDLLGGIVITNVPGGLCALTATPSQTFALPTGRLRYDVWVTRTDTSRRRAMFGTLITDGVVNFP